MAVRLLCPTCRREIEWTEAFPYRPFCSERCRLIDLGAWLGEQRAIPGEPVPEPGGDRPDEDRHGRAASPDEQPGRER